MNDYDEIAVNGMEDVIEYDDYDDAVGEYDDYDDAAEYDDYDDAVGEYDAEYDDFDDAAEYDDYDDAAEFLLPNPLKMAKSLLGRRTRRRRRPQYRPRVARGRRGVSLSGVAQLRKYVPRTEFAKAMGVAARERRTNAKAIRGVTSRVNAARTQISGVDRKLKRTGRELIKVNTQQSKQIGQLKKDFAQARQLSLMTTLLQKAPEIKSATVTQVDSSGNAVDGTARNVVFSNVKQEEADNMLFLLLAMGGLGGSNSGGMDNSVLLALALSGGL